jgi:ZIP family zinc transporter
VAAFMAVTAGLLSFLAFDAFAEALGLQALLPGGFEGTGLILLGIAAGYLGLTFISQRFSTRQGRASVRRGPAPRRAALRGSAARG